MTFQGYGQRIMSLKEFDEETKKWIKWFKKDFKRKTQKCKFTLVVMGWTISLLLLYKNAKFGGNVLIVGSTGCGKTYLIQKLAVK